jgi:hypothetical protein
MDLGGNHLDRGGRPLPTPLRAGRFLLLGLALAVAMLGLQYAASGAQALQLMSKTFVMQGTDAKARLTVRCPKKNLPPLSGGMITDPVGSDGEGIYPHSYERLGVQRGWHVTPVLFAPSRRQGGGPRSLTLQVLCAPRLGPVSSKRRTVFVRPGESATAVATCPRGEQMFSGGFQRTNFVTGGGNYITGSRAASSRSWQVTGGGFGHFGGELTAIAYCMRSRGALVWEVSGETALPVGKSAIATTPACPPGSSLIGGGFATTPANSALVSSAYFNPDNSWSAIAYNNFGPAATLSAHGYCMASSTIRHRQRMRHRTRSRDEKSIKAPKILDSALKVAISERVIRNGCYPPPSQMAARLRAKHIRARTARNPHAVRSANTVNVLIQGSACGRARFAVRHPDGVIVLDSATGEVRQRKR